MTTSIPPGVMYVVQPILHSAATRRATVTYAYSINGDEQISLNSAFTAFSNAWDQNLDSQATMQPCQGYWRDATGDPLQTTFSVQPAVVGTRVGSSQVSSVALRVTKRTAFIGKGFRGRIYIPWVLTEADVDEVGNLLPATQATFQGHASGWLTALNAGVDVGQMLLLHNYDPDLGPDPETPGDAITSLFVQPSVGTQRRRVSL